MALDNEERRWEDVHRIRDALGMEEWKPREGETAERAFEQTLAGARLFLECAETLARIKEIVNDGD